ncbi:MAG: lipase [Proteobacteria bacterium]|nr:MAG: lipase [Pseudomonadota bacterium]
MTALILFGLLVAGFAGYISWAAHHIAHGAAAWWFIAGAPIAYFLPAMVFSTVWFTVTWIWRSPRPPEARLGIDGILRLFFGEVWALGVSWPLMALHSLLMHDPAPVRATLPVLLVHGVLVNDGMWFQFRRALVARGIAPVYTMNYGPPYADIEIFAEQLAAKIDSVCAATGAQRVVLVGHSMGGLVSRTYLRRFGSDRVAKLITIGTPHHGSVLAWSFVGRGLEQMRPGNSWLVELNRDENQSPPVPIISIWSRHDSMVAPQASSVLACAENVALVGVGHNALLGDARVVERAAQEVNAACATSPVSM